MSHITKADLRDLRRAGAKLIALTAAKSPAGETWAAAIDKVEAWPGAIGLFPVTAKLICIDIDKGDAYLIFDIAKAFGLRPILHPTGRIGGFHIWIRGRSHKPEHDVAKKDFSHAGASGQIIIGSDRGSQGAYCKLWNIDAVMEALDSPPANSDALADFIDLLLGCAKSDGEPVQKSGKACSKLGEIGRARVRGAVSSAKRRAKAKKQKQKQKTLTTGDSRKTHPKTYHWLRAQWAGYWIGNRNSQLNKDVYSLAIQGKAFDYSIELARAAGLPDKEIASTVRSAVTAAESHWWHRLQNGRLNTDGLTNRQGDTALRVLQAIARGADYKHGTGSRQSQATIAKQAGCTDRTVRNTIPKLIKLNLLHKTGEHITKQIRHRSGKVWHSKVDVYAINLIELDKRMAG